MSNFALEIDELYKKYKNGPEALKGVNLNIEHGDFYALLGVNGAGKSTIINIITDLVTKTSGTVKVYGNNIDEDFNLVKSLIGVVPQEFNFDIFSKIIDIVTTVGGFYGMNYYDAKKRANQVLFELGLGDKINTQAMKLSGGMKRRLMIARGLIHSPKLLILDEPTAGVDVDLRNGMWSYLREINEKGTTILLTTHYLEEVEQLCRNASILKDGKIAMEGSVKNLLTKLDSEVYLVENKSDIDDEISTQLQDHFGQNLKKINQNIIEIEINSKLRFSDMLSKITSIKLEPISIRPKGNRLEELFLNVIK